MALFNDLNCSFFFQIMLHTNNIFLIMAVNQTNEGKPKTTKGWFMSFQLFLEDKYLSTFTNSL